MRVTRSFAAATGVPDLVCAALIGIAAAGSPALAAVPNQSVASEDSVRSAWLQKNAARLRSADPKDEDFRDLEPLRRAIGDARVVLLGEQTHGDGTTFLMKTRLIKFLHQKMGFDVIAFESGLFDCAKAWEFIRAGEDPEVAFRRAVFKVWTGSEQVRPLTNYVGAMAHTRHPLELAGVDSQFSGSASKEYLLTDFEAFMKSNGVDLAQLQDWTSVRPLLDDVIKNPRRTNATDDQLKALLTTLAQLRDRVRKLPSKDAAQKQAATFWAQVLKSTYAQVPYDVSSLANIGTLRTSDNNSRDYQMGDNLIWLARERYPDRKIIVWAATSHNARNIDTVDKPEVPGFYESSRPMGHVASQAIGDQMYNIGFIASEGTWTSWLKDTYPVTPPPTGSLEAAWAGTNHQISFLDFKKRKPGDEWLHKPLLAGPLGYAPMRSDWTNVLDGFIYTRAMEPSTPIKQ